MEGLWVSDSNNHMTEVPQGLLSEIAEGDIRRRRLSGRAAQRQEFRGNIVESRLEDIEFVEVDFSRCDWKDCRIDRATFIDCDLGHASMITNAFADCIFIGCRFPDTGVSDSSYSGCRFEQCNFTSIIVKSSRFEECFFDGCQTSNRIIESSLLLRTAWRGMELALTLVTGNFGLRQSELSDCRLVSTIGGGDEVSESVALAVPELNPIERFRLSYFWSGEVDGDPEALEAALDLRNWSNDAVVQASLGAQLSSFSQFLLALYYADDAPLYPLLVLHSKNFAFLEWLAGREELLPLYQISAGVHLTLTREVDAFAVQLTVMTDAMDASTTVHFAAEGPVDPDYFRRWFREIGMVGVRVVSVRPRNSPIDLATAFSDHGELIGAIALFLACRTRLELLKLATTSRTDHDELGRGRSLVAFSAGFSKVSPADYEINVRTLLPRSLLLDLHLCFSVAVFKRARAVLVGLIMPGASVAAPPSTPHSRGGRSRRRSPRA